MSSLLSSQAAAEIVNRLIYNNTNWNQAVECGSTQSPKCKFVPPGSGTTLIEKTFNLRFSNMEYDNPRKEYYPIIEGTARLKLTLNIHTSDGTLSVLPEFRKWIEIRDTTCTGNLIARRDIFPRPPPYYVFHSRDIQFVEPLMPNHNYCISVHVDDQNVSWSLVRRESISYKVNVYADIDLPPLPKVVPALPWQAEILFMACLLVAGLWTDNKKRRHSTLTGV